jgi:hypothetical protein
MAGFRALRQSERLGRLNTLRYSGNVSGDWWELVRDAFPGNEAWGEEFLPEEEIPF